MNKFRHAQLLVRGFTLIELMIALAIASTLMLVAIPNYRAWVHNSKIRLSAESVLHGLQAARAEAIRLNAMVEFRLAGPNAGGADWSIVVPDTGTAAQAQEMTLVKASDGQAIAGDNAASVQIISQTGTGVLRTVSATQPEMVAFTGLGVLASASEVRRFDFQPVVANDGRALAIVIGGAGSVRLCDPAFSRATNVQGC